jgi:hypothetical protein
LSTLYHRDNLELAATARDAADRAPDGSFEKAVAGSVAVTCATTRTLDDARHVLGGIVPEEVRKPAIDFLDHLIAGHDGPARLD